MSALLSVADPTTTVSVNGIASASETAPVDIHPGDVLDVAGNGVAELRLESGAVLRIGAGSSATFDSAGANEARLSVVVGSVWLAAATGDPTNVVVEIPGATATASGASVAVICDPVTCHIGAADGPAIVAPNAGALINLQPHQYATVAGGVVSGPAAFPPSALVVVPFLQQNAALDVQEGLRTSAEGTVIKPIDAMLDGAYRVTYTTTENDRDDVTGTSIDRTARIATTCLGLACAITFTTELSNGSGSVIELSTPMTFDGTTYHGVLTQSNSCSDFAPRAAPDAAVDYTGTVDLTPDAAAFLDGRLIVTGYSSINLDVSIVNPAGQASGCRINLRNDGFSARSLTVGVGVRLA